ncbi:hypothetical protein BIV57_16395 [Mangrovactinospora gilvigrisea]|uniref:Uncharacterized protein n=1 Tax=Mangrovactinospora gilvigrisea TaxID=1428644 RepID=A0A1J7BCK0_9ACTN|nr:hypothetical protein BIV57_16395 [Mangrovactinospora gilvigrisea]
MGMAALYVAFALVTLWLVGEVLMQRGAKLHWRLLALLGFLCVVGGVALRSMPVIAGGVVLFGTGQAFVTLSVRKGGVDAWGIDAPWRKSAAGRSGHRPPVQAQPQLQVEPVEEAAPMPAAAPAPSEVVAAGADAAGAEYAYPEYPEYAQYAQQAEPAEYAYGQQEHQQQYADAQQTAYQGYEGYGAQYAEQGQAYYPEQQQYAPQGEAQGGYDPGLYQATGYEQAAYTPQPYDPYDSDSGEHPQYRLPTIPHQYAAEQDPYGQTRY